MRLVGCKVAQIRVPHLRHVSLNESDNFLQWMVISGPLQKMGLAAWVYGLIGAGTVIVAAGVILIMLQFVFLLRKRISTPILPCIWTKSLDPVSSKDVSKNGTDLAGCRKAFTFKEVEEFCEGFINLVGESPCHCVYKGILGDGTEIAVKRTKEIVASSIDVEKSYRFQVDLLSRIHHRHIVNLIGFCEENQHRMLVFQYAPNGSLFDSLHNGEEHLSWKQRMHIAVSIACGMAYLHHSCGSPIIHGDLTSRNVLLMEDNGAKIYGIVAPSLYSKSTLISTDGGCADSGLQEKAVSMPSKDVYSFGALLLELISGKPAFSNESGMLVEWAGQFLQSRDQVTTLTDPTLKNVIPLELYSVCEVARLCVQQEASSRPSMEGVLYMLSQSLGMESDTPASSLTT